MCGLVRGTRVKKKKESVEYIKKNCIFMQNIEIVHSKYCEKCVFNEINRKTFPIIFKLKCSMVVRKPKCLTKNERDNF